MLRPTPLRHVPCGFLAGFILLALLAGLACRGPAPTAHEATDRKDATAPTGPTPYRAGTLEEVRLTDDFWRPRLERNRTVTIPHIFRENRETGRVANFERAAGRLAGQAEEPYEGRRFNDTDVYKAIEAASYALAESPARDRDSALRAQVDDLVRLIAAAQEPDGYLVPARTIDPEHPAAGLGPERWIHVSAGSHELYDAGHLIEAAVAHWRATGDRTLLDVAIRFADRIDADFGPDARHAVPGHEEVELALVKLADATGERRYLDLARFFLDGRGGDHDDEPYPEDTPFAIYNDRPYRQDDRPVIAQDKVEGHAVRAMYLYSGMADVAARTGAPGYETALTRVWHDLVARQLYLTGGIGARDTFESFGAPYELPNDTAYTETCAAVGNDLWNHRMFLASGEARYLDLVERILYNGFLSGVSLSGDRFFYTNPLASEGGIERSPYFEVACCPANLARMMALLPTFLYAVGTPPPPQAQDEAQDEGEGGARSGGRGDRTGEEIVVSLYAGSEATLQTAAGPVRIVQRTRYPWQGTVHVELHPEEAREIVLALRIPGWAREQPVPSDLYRFADAPAPFPTLEIDGQTVTLTPGRHPLASRSGQSGGSGGPVGDCERDGAGRPAGEIVVADGFARVRRVWSPQGGAGNGVDLHLPMPARRVAADPRVSADAGRLALQRGPVVYAVEGVDNGGSLAGVRLPAAGAVDAAWQPDLLGGVVTLITPGRSSAAGATTSEPAGRLVAIPYFAWANRGPDEMAVWLPAGPGAGH